MRHHRLLAALLTLTALLAFGAGTAAADGDGAPANIQAFANAPGWITVTWDHSGDDIYGFVLEQESPFAFQQLDAGKRVFTVASLEANRTYRYRVCAVYDYHRECSEYAQATTLPPPATPSRPAPGTPPPSAPKPLTKPVLTATQHSALEIVLRWEHPGYADRLTSAKLYRDGRFIYEALTPGNFDSDHVDGVSPNTEYVYKLCFTNPDEEQCSDPVTAMAKPVAPTAPADLRVQRLDLPGGTTADGSALFRPRYAVHLTWRNTTIPGQFITVERGDVRVARNADPNSPIEFVRQSVWSEVARLSAKSNPVSATVDAPRGANLATNPTVLEEGKTYRVCAVVPALGATGRVCSQPASLP